jgi:hypothetical protein
MNSWIISLMENFMRHHEQLVTSTLATAFDRENRPLCTVKEAASRAGKSISRLYKMDRQYGPFRFVLRGRRVFVDVDSFELYLSNLDGLAPESGTVPSAAGKSIEETASIALNGVFGESTNPNAQDIQAPTKFQESIPVGRFGQRELIIRRSDRVSVVAYLV